MDDPQQHEDVFAAVEDPDAPPLKVQRFRPDEARGALPEFAELIDLWLERRGGEAVPDWSDFDFPDFVGWHAFLMLSRFESDAPDPTFRLAGEKVTDLMQFQLSGRRLSSLAPRNYEQRLRDHFSEIRAQGLIGLTTGQLPVEGRSHAVMRILELPFREGGATVERLLHVMSRTAN